MGITIDQLTTLPFFEGMESEFLETFAACGKEQTYSYGHLLFFEGDSADKFYIIKKGKIALQMGAGSLGLFTIELLEENEPVGWSWMIPPYRWSLTARVQSPLELLVFDANVLREACEKTPRMQYDLLLRTSQVAAKRLVASRMALMNNLI